MFGIGGFELFIILIFGFLIFGPDKLPDIAKTVGKGIARFREAQQEVNDVIGDEKLIDFDNPDQPIKDPMETLDRIAKRHEEKKESAAEKASSSEKEKTSKKTSDSSKDDQPQQESFTERKARYERERAARKAAEAEKAAAAEEATESKPAAPVPDIIFASNEETETSTATTTTDSAQSDAPEGGDA